MSDKQLYVKVNTVDFTAWLVQSFWNQSQEDGLKEYLRVVGVEAFTYEHPSFFDRLQGWMEVPQGSCITLKF